MIASNMEDPISLGNGNPSERSNRKRENQRLLKEYRMKKNSGVENINIKLKKNTAVPMTSDTEIVLVRQMQCNYCSFNTTLRHDIRTHVEKSHRDICVIGLGFTVKYINTKIQSQRLKDTRTYKTKSNNRDSVNTAKVEPAGDGVQHYDSESMTLKAANVRVKLKHCDGDDRLKLTPEDKNRVKLEHTVKLEPVENTEANGDDEEIYKYLERLRNEENRVKLENTVKLEAVENTEANGDEAIYKYLDRLSRGTSSSKAPSSCSPKQDSAPVFDTPALQVMPPPPVSKTTSSPGSQKKKMTRVLQCNFCNYLIVKKKCCFIKMKQHINKMHPPNDRVEAHNSGYSIQYKEIKMLRQYPDRRQNDLQLKKDFKVPTPTPTILNVGTVKIKIKPDIQDQNQKQEADANFLDDNVKMEVNDYGEEMKEEAKVKLLMDGIVKLEREDSDI